MKNCTSKFFRKNRKSVHSDGDPYRHFFCQNCHQSINICVSCDRGQIYCPPCQKICRKNRIQKARFKYAHSEKGRRKRSDQNRRRYLLKKTGKKDFQGDRGSPSKEEAVGNFLPASRPVEGVKNEGDVFPGTEPAAQDGISEGKKDPVVCALFPGAEPAVQDGISEGKKDPVVCALFPGTEPAAQDGISEGKKDLVVCAFCHQVCASFRRPQGPWRRHKKIWKKKKF